MTNQNSHYMCIVACRELVRVTGFDMHFASQNKCSNQCLHWLQRYATSISHLDGFESSTAEKEICENHISDSRIFGPSYWIRTSGLLNPIQARYQTSPNPDFACVFRQPQYDNTLLRKMQALFLKILKLFADF